ncbi:uncharacterized protein BYT42DRAFT_82209 [Radiomyces spectabilis]|uniref:uncharacterized protein n=1 Tax=Radiomyces spectabilis TaxID=64574 RepID=UPI0022206036|nr:uncharacterized protein BYT42DRAFT_82209 [Radiomyces spectabilis]KAI8371795.1 hypothetical protein BYT42DRAFT_82209 [Radiomyces spectabilis]
MAKIWNEFFEHMFADGYLLVKSGGEPVSSTTTQVKPRNSSIISCKVDGRTVASINGILELRQIEASKLLNSNAKVRHEQAKLAIECKCILDDIVRSLSFSRDKPHYIHGVQICGLQAQVSSLSLIDSGLYTNVGDFSFSLPSDIDEFGENLPMWTRKILSFRNSCIYSATNYKSAVNLEKRNHKIAPHETVPSRKKLSEWTRGTFFIPEKDQEPHFPDGFLGNSSSSCYDDAIYDKYYLDDGTLVKERRYVTKKRMDKTKQDKKTITKEGSSNKEAEANEYPNKKKKGNDEQRNTSTEAI